MESNTIIKAAALAIGNSNYSLPGMSLANCVNDADDIKSKLEELGYDVTLLKDATKEVIDNKVKSLCTKSNDCSVAVVYYSGHGREIAGNNYLISVDTPQILKSNIETIIKQHLVNIDDIIALLDKAGFDIKVIVLDACRNNIEGKSFGSIEEETIKSFTKITSQKTGVYVAFATSSGLSSYCSKTMRNSYYTQALLNYICENISIEDCFKKVRKQLINDKCSQMPWEYSSLITNFSFNINYTKQDDNNPTPPNTKSTLIRHALLGTGQTPQVYQYKYENELIYTSNNTAIDEVITNLQSHNWYTQNYGMNILSRIVPNSVDKEEQFLLGRNLLQTALGGEYSAMELFKKLNTWLIKWNEDNENHVLNGMLYEMYFDKTATFRGGDHLKAGYQDELFTLANDGKFYSSFDYIAAKLTPYTDYLYFVPSNNMQILELKVNTKIEKRRLLGEYIEEYYAIEKILLDNKDIYSKNNVHFYRESFEAFCNRLRNKLCIDKKHLCIEVSDENIKESEIAVGNILIKPKGYDMLL